MADKNTYRLKSIDGLKGLSIIAVICYYFFEHELPGGYLAVNIFLLVAGFFNFRHFINADQDGLVVNTKEYYKRRFKRLFFPMLAAVSITIVLILFFAPKYFYNIRNLAAASLTFVNNIYQTIVKQSYFVQALNPSPFTHLWYVSLYGQLVLLTPLIVKAFYSWNRKPIVLANFLFVLSLVSVFLMAYFYKPGTDPTNVYYCVFTRMFPYTLGGAIGVLLPKKFNWKKLKRKTRISLDITSTIAVFLIFMMFKFMYATQAFAYRFGMLLFSLVAMILLVTSLHPETFWNKVLSLKPLCKLGQRSYSYYLVYYPIFLIGHDMFSFINNKAVLTTVLQFGLIMILSELIYQIFEQKRISLPFGQDFNREKMKFQINYLKKHPGQLRTVKSTSLIYLVILVVAAVSVFFAPEKRDNKANELKERIETNKTIIEETQTEDVETTKIINNIEGLTQEELLYVNGLELTFIGDSTILVAADSLSEVFPKAVNDSAVSRQLYDSIPVVESLKASNKLHSVVVTGMGSNGTFTQAQIDDYIEAIGSEREIYFVTSQAQRPWVGSANEQMTQAAQRHGNIKIIDWANYSKDHSEWFEDDAGHLTVEGAHEFSVYVAKELYRQR